MGKSKEHRSYPDLTDEELAGFVRLLLAGNKLPKETPDIVAFLERVAKQSQEDKPRVDNSQPRVSRARSVSERLKEVCPRPIRPFGTHLLAKRTAAGCQVDEVSRILDERPDLLRDIERRSIDPLDLEITKLTKISIVFGLGPAELRESLVLDYCSQQERRDVGTPFARSSERDFKSEVLQIATEDLRRAACSHDRESELNNQVVQRIMTIVQAVVDRLER